MSTVRVALDSGPLHGTRTGIGAAVAELIDALARDPSVDVVPYLLSARSRPSPGTVRLPLPAAVALRLWSTGAGGNTSRPVVDRALAGVDVIHGTNYVAPPSRLPRLVSVYDVWFLKQPGSVGADVHRRAAVLRRNIAEGVTVHTSSTATATALAELAPGARVEVVQLGPIPLPEPSVRPPIAAVAGRPYVLFTGTLERRKNVPGLVAAFGRIAVEQPDLHLVVAGPDGDDRAAVDAAVLALSPDVSRRVHLAGWVSGPARTRLLQEAAMLAYPSFDEGFGFPLLDAMQVGIPIVAGDAGSIPEVAGDAALLAAPDDIDALAAHLGHALDPAVATRLVTAGAARLAQFSWATTAARMVTLYHRLVEESPS
jgi:glycosyltransferase involved in cell wall biosynthesis